MDGEICYPRSFQKDCYDLDAASVEVEGPSGQMTSVDSLVEQAGYQHHFIEQRSPFLQVTDYVAEVRLVNSLGSQRLWEVEVLERRALLGRRKYFKGGFGTVDVEPNDSMCSRLIGES